MTGSSVGWWTARFQGVRQITLWHYVESEIEDRLVTRCGRQMHKQSKRGDLLTANSADDACKACR